MELTKLKRDFRVGSRRQRGVATLMVSVSIALLMAVAAVGMMRSGMLEQRIAANDMRSREVQELAQAGWDYVMASGDVGVISECDDPLPINLPKLSIQFPKLETIEELEVEFFGCYKDVGGKRNYRVKSVARSENSNVGSSAVVEAIFQRGSLINSNLGGMPSPFLIKGNFCAGGCKGGSPEINSENMPGVVVTGTAKVDGFSDRYRANEPDDGVPLSGSAWSNVFGISLNEAKLMATTDSGNPFYYTNGNTNANTVSGSKNRPVVVIVGYSVNNNKKKCYHLNGGATIYGIIYFEDGCDMKGMGDFTLYGAIVSDGDIDKINGNPSFNKFELESWNYLIGLNENSKSFMVPGTWRDFEPQP